MVIPEGTVLKTPQAQQIQFEENGELINMEIDVGHKAAHEFATSDDESQEMDTESDSDQSDAETNYEDNDEERQHDEEGEITSEGEIVDDEEGGKTSQNVTPVKNQTERKKSKRASITKMESKIDSLSNSLQVLQEFMMKQQKEKQGNALVTVSKGKKTDKNSQSAKTGMVTEVSQSDMTIYQNFLEKIDDNNDGQINEVQVDPEITFKKGKQTKRDSSSSEDHVDTSDDMIEMDVDFNDRFIADCEQEAQRICNSFAEDRVTATEVQNQAANYIKEAEAAKARILNTPGKTLDFSQSPLSANVDDNYIIVGAHIDDNLKNKVSKGGYVNFAKLIPKDRPSYDDNRLEIVSKGGSTFFVPASDRENANVISSLYKREQVFRVFSNIYLKANQDRATQLIQYNHIICTAAATFSWDNVYNYDRELRMHLENYPQRSWSIILQQAWSMCLKDRTNFNHGSGKQGFNKKKIRKKFVKDLTGVNAQQVAHASMTTDVLDVENSDTEYTYVIIKEMEK